MKVILLILSLTMINDFVMAKDSPFKPAEEAQSIIFGKKVYLVEHKDAKQIITQCKLQSGEKPAHWVITKDYVKVLDGLLQKRAKGLGISEVLKTSHLQYMGVQTNAGKKYVYIFVYRAPSRVIDKEVGNAVVLCRKSSATHHIIEVDVDTAKYNKITI